MLILFLCAMKDNVNVLGSQFDRWNLIGLISVCIVVCLGILFCLQMCFKPKSKAEAMPEAHLVGESILEEA